MRTAIPLLMISVAACNAPPDIISVSLAPEAPTTVDALILTVDATDADENEIELTVEWTVDGAPQVDLADALTVPAARTAKGQTWTATVIASDGVLDTAPEQASVGVVNTPPTGESVAISPEQPAITDSLTCTPAGFSDVDGDAEQWRYAWTVDGIDVGDEPTLAVASVGYGQVAICTVVPTDGDAEGDAISARVTGINTAPVLRDLSLAPSLATTSTDLTAVPGAAGDVDGDEVRVLYAWTVNDVAVAETGATLSADHFVKGDVVAVTATPTDEIDLGEAVSTSIGISNSAPAVADLAITPPEATTLDALTLSWAATDPDGDSILAISTWRIDGASVGSGTTLAPGVAQKGDTVRAEVIVSDGTDDSTDTVEITVGNAPPAAPGVAIDPADGPREGEDDLLCFVATDATDPDAADTLDYTFSWSADGVAWMGSTATTTYPGDTIGRGDTTGGETWTCSVVADDGTDVSPAATASVDVVTCTTSTVYINADDSGCISYGSTREVWKDNRVRAYNDSSKSDVVGWLLFDLSGVDPDAEVLSASVDLFEEWGSVDGAPKLVFVESPTTGWSRSTLTTTSVVKGGRISGETTSFTFNGWNTFDLDVDDWDWETDLANGEATIGTDNVAFGYSFVYFEGPDTTGKVPELALEIEVCK